MILPELSFRPIRWVRAILVSLLGGCVLCLVSGCGGSNDVEMPKNPTPAPKNAKLECGNAAITPPGKVNPPPAVPGKKKF